MLMVFGVLVASVPLVVVFVLFAWASRRERLRRDLQACQVALTDRVHERLGAVAAPLVRRLRRGWQVRMAVPFECPALTASLLAIVLETFASRACDRRTLEIVLTRRPDPRRTKRAVSDDVRWESPSWT
jgi:hypothetical protein